MSDEQLEELSWTGIVTLGWYEPPRSYPNGDYSTGGFNTCSWEGDDPTFTAIITGFPSMPPGSPAPIPIGASYDPSGVPESDRARIYRAPGERSRETDRANHELAQRMGGVLALVLRRKARAGYDAAGRQATLG